MAVTGSMVTSISTAISRLTIRFFMSLSSCVFSLFSTPYRQDTAYCINISVPPPEIPGKNNIHVNLHEISKRFLTIRITADKKREKPQIAVASPVLIVSFRVCLLILSAISVDAVPVANYGIRFLHDPADGFVQQLQVVDVHGTVAVDVHSAPEAAAISPHCRRTTTQSC